MNIHETFADLKRILNSTPQRLQAEYSEEALRGSLGAIERDLAVLHTNPTATPDLRSAMEQAAELLRRAIALSGH